MKNGRLCLNCQPNKQGNCSNRTQESPIQSQQSASDSNTSITNTITSPQTAPRFSRNCFTLPEFVPCSQPHFRWGEEADAATFIQNVKDAYKEIVTWRKNIFFVPSGKVGRKFVSELSRLFRAYGGSSALESISLMAAMILPALVLQKPTPKAKAKALTGYLERRLALWEKGDIPALLMEGKIIQSKLKSMSRSIQKDQLPKKFSKLLRHGKVKAAMRLLSSSEASILSVNDMMETPSGESRLVLEELRAKHPSKAAIDPDTIITTPERDFHPVVFDEINANTIRKAFLKTTGGAGPSGTDAAFWKRLCSSFTHSSNDLCASLALVAKKISTTYVDPEGLTCFTASRLIALDKMPGIRPIGIGEVVRRAISKAIVTTIQDDIKQVAGCTQLCAGIEAGSEVGVHSLRKIFNDTNCEAILLADASNAFNCLNRQTALLNIQALCPALAIPLINTYRQDPSLFIEGECLFSSEGTTQGDPLATSMYALGILPLIRQLDHLAHQLWFADDASAGGSLTNLQTWWSKLTEAGPSYGYYPNPSKSWLIVKEEHANQAHSLFSSLGVNITTKGHRHLGSAIGEDDFIEFFLKKKVEQWLTELTTLIEIARTEPHAAYCGFIHGFKHQLTYSMRTTPYNRELLLPIEDLIRHKFIPTLIGRNAVSDIERQLLALPPKHGGLGITDFTQVASEYYQASSEICGPIVNCIVNQQQNIDEDISAEQQRIKLKVISEKRKKDAATASTLSLPDHLFKAAELAQDKGSSSWLTTLPLEKYGFYLSKSDFKDALSLRYGWMPERMPSKCVCNETFTIDHALSCPRGAFPTIRHNEIRDFTGMLLTEVCHDVSLEPVLHPLSGEELQHATARAEDEARVDIAARNFWGNRQKAFFDVKVFNPFAKSNQKFSLASCFNHHEKTKRRSYEQRIIEVEHGSFTPLVFSASGSMGRSATIFYRRLATQLADKRNEPYPATMGWLRCHLSFSLVRSAILCIRGTRSRANFIPRIPDSTDLAVTELHTPT